MTSFNFLDKQLVPYAEEAMQHFSRKIGVPASKFLIEQSIGSGLTYRPTFHTFTREKRIFCLDLVMSYTIAMDTVVLECMRSRFPIEIWLAVSPGANTTLKDIIRAAVAGIGIVQLDALDTTVRPAIPLSLVTVNKPRLEDYPQKYRQPVDRATEMFLSAEPSKGVSLLYDEIESVIRRLAMKADARSCWKGTGGKSPGLDWEKAAWQHVNQTLLNNLDVQKLSCPDLTVPKLGRILGLSDYRNASNHAPSLAKRIIRDREIRTRFEVAATSLKELLDATKKLRL